MALRREGFPSEDKLMLLGEAAQLYYIERYTQDRIARQLNVSRSNVSRMLKEARDLGLVEIRVRAPMEAAWGLGREIRARLGLRECLALATRRPSGGGDVQAFGALHVQQYITEGAVVGVGWSSAVHGVVNSGRLRERKGLTVVQLMGSLGGAVPDLDGATITGSLARALGARTHLLQAPMLVASAAIRDGLLRDRHIAHTLSLAERADVTMVGVGTIDQNSGQYRTGYLDDADIESIRARGAAGEICGSYFNGDGARVRLELDDRLVGLGFEELRRVPIRVGLGWGVRKASANIGAARSGLVNVLVTDEATAREMLLILETEDV